MSLLELTRITKSFGGLTAIQNVDLTLEQGKIIGLIGPNGAGKSTLFNVITGFIKSEKGGQILFKGKPIQGLTPNAIGAIGIARTFQTPKPFRSQTVIENVMVGSYLRTSHYEEAREKALEVLRFIGMEKKRDLFPSNLTLADHKRMEIGRALATEPDLLMLDEAVNGLNPAETEEMIELNRRIRDNGITLFIVEHVMRVIMSLSDWIVILHHGRKIAEGIPKNVTADEKVIKAYLGEDFVF